MNSKDYKDSNTHWLAVYIWNEDLTGAQQIIGLPDLDHDQALLEVIRSPITIFSNGLRIIEKMLNGYLIKDTAVIIQACILHGHTAILSLIIDKYTQINRDWFYYAFSQLSENIYAAARPHNTARWIINYAAEHGITIQTNDVIDMLCMADRATINAALDAVYDNTGHYRLLINHLWSVNTCELSANVVKYLYDNGHRKYTNTEYATATLRGLIGGLVCNN